MIHHILMNVVNQYQYLVFFNMAQLEGCGMIRITQFLAEQSQETTRNLPLH